MNHVDDMKGLEKVTMHPFVDQRGMTLPEILAAVVVIMVALVALASAIPMSAYGIQEGSQLTTATFLANQRLEQVKQRQWTEVLDEIDFSASATAAPPTFPDESPVAAPYTQYTRTVRIIKCAAVADCGGVVDPNPDPPAGLGPGLRQVTVTVSYRPLTGQGQAAAGSTKSAIVTLVVSRR
jgi:type II secretory pathway pseudopilin PulG